MKVWHGLRPDSGGEMVRAHKNDARNKQNGRKGLAVVVGSLQVLHAETRAGCTVLLVHR